MDKEKTKRDNQWPNPSPRIAPSRVKNGYMKNIMNKKEKRVVKFVSKDEVPIEVAKKAKNNWKLVKTGKSRGLFNLTFEKDE